MPCVKAENHPKYRIDILPEEVRKLYREEFLSTKQIAEIFNCDPNTIRHRLEKTNSLQRRRRRLDITDSELLLKYNSGIGVVAISRQFHCRRVTITRRLNRLGVSDIRRASLTGERNHKWKGGRIKQRGYIMIYAPDHPRAHPRYVAEHVLVWEKAHKQRLPKGWIIHHINGIRDDNRPSNLLAMVKEKHYTRQLLLQLRTRIDELEKENKHLRATLGGSLPVLPAPKNTSLARICAN